MNVTVTVDSEGWYVVTANGVEIDAFRSCRDAHMFANYYSNKLSNVSLDYNRGYNQ